MGTGFVNGAVGGNEGKYAWEKAEYRESKEWYNLDAPSRVSGDSCTYLYDRIAFSMDSKPHPSGPKRALPTDSTSSPPLGAAVYGYWFYNNNKNVRLFAGEVFEKPDPWGGMKKSVYGTEITLIKDTLGYVVDDNAEAYKTPSEIIAGSQYYIKIK